MTTRAPRVPGPLRVKPFRGDQVAAGVVVLTTLVWVLQLRFTSAWGAGAHLAYAALALAFVASLAAGSPLEPGMGPRAYQSILVLCTLALALPVLANLAELFGADSPLRSAGARCWIAALLAALMAAFAWRRSSGLATLAACVSTGVALFSGLTWIFEPDGARAYRWLLAALLAFFALAAVGTRDRRPRHAVAFAEAGGLAALVIGLTELPLAAWVVEGGRTPNAPWGWELLVLAGGFGLIAYAAVERRPVPAGIGVANLIVFVLVVAGDGSGATFVGWPIVLALIAAALLIIGLRPTTPAPPPPDEGRPPAPTEPIRFR